MDYWAATGCLRRRLRRRARRSLLGRVLVGAMVLAVLSLVLVLAGGCAPEVVTSTSVSAPGGSSTTEGPGTAPSSSPSTDAPRPEETTTTSGPPDVVKIGALFSLTGDLALQGESALKGMRLAIEEVNAAGGIASLGGIMLTLVEADTKGDPGLAEAEVARLVQEQGVVAIVGTGQSRVALDATDAAERLEIPFVVSAGAADQVTERGLEYTFRLCPKAGWYARDQVAFLLALKEMAGREITNVALLHEDGEYGKQTAEDQKAYLEQAGIAVVADVAYSPGSADLHGEILEIKHSGAQAILTATFPGDAALIATAADVLRVRVPIVDAAGGVLDAGFIADAGEASEAIISVAEFACGLSPARALDERCRDEGGVADAGMLYAYQAVWLLASALERAGSVGGPDLRLALNTTALYGEHLVLPQNLLTFDGDGQNRGARLLAVQVQDGEMVIVWPVDYAEAAIRPQ